LDTAASYFQENSLRQKDVFFRGSDERFNDGAGGMTLGASIADLAAGAAGAAGDKARPGARVCAGDGAREGVDVAARAPRA